MTYYHGTSSKKVRSILKEGLRLDCKHVWDADLYRVRPKGWRVEEKFTVGKMKGKPVPPRIATCGVFLTEDPFLAEHFAKDATYKFDGDPVVLQVNCLAPGAKVGGDGYGYLMTTKPVPPECIEPFDFKNWKGRRKYV